jgi:hypothetical protein
MNVKYSEFFNSLILIVAELGFKSFSNIFTTLLTRNMVNQQINATINNINKLKNSKEMNLIDMKIINGMYAIKNKQTIDNRDNNKNSPQINMFINQYLYFIK